MFYIYIYIYIYGGAVPHQDILTGYIPYRLYDINYGNFISQILPAIIAFIHQLKRIKKSL